MSTRKIAISNEHVTALNMIEVDFYGCDEVISAWKVYLDHLNAGYFAEDDAWRETRERRLAELLFQIGAVLKFDIPALDLYKGGYAPKGWAYKDSRQNEVLEFFHEMRVGEREFPIWLKGITQPQQQDQQANAAQARQ